MELLDYARPLMLAETALKDMYNATLDKKFDLAYEKGLIAITEMRLALAAVNNERNKE